MLTKLQLNQIKSYFSHQPDVVAAYLFGSQATGRSGRTKAKQDIDVAALFAEYVDESARFDRTLALASDIHRIVHRETDVIDLNSAPNLLRMNVILGKLLVCADDQVRAGFEVDTLREYHDREYLDLIDRTILYQDIAQQIL